MHVRVRSIGKMQDTGVVRPHQAYRHLTPQGRKHIRTSPVVRPPGLPRLSVSSLGVHKRHRAYSPPHPMPSYKQLVELLHEHKFDTTGFRDRFCDYLPHATEISSNHSFDVIVEHQRGFKWFGIPLFSSKSLLPLLDPPSFSRLDGSKILLANDSLDNYVLPDLDWSWVWDSWYVLMLSDVDEQGWLYSSFWRFNPQWHGKYYFGDFVRKRLWIRLRKNSNSDH